MNWTSGQIVTSMGMRLDEGVPIDLRGGLDTQAFLTIGDGIEITLGEEHVRTLRDQAAAALGDMALIETAENMLGDAYHAGAQARTAAALARRHAEAAQAAGDTEQADRAYQAARHATEAAEQAQAAAHTAYTAMTAADDAAEQARAAVHATQAAGPETPGGKSGPTLHLV